MATEGILSKLQKAMSTKSVKNLLTKKNYMTQYIGDKKVRGTEDLVDGKIIVTFKDGSNGENDSKNCLI